MSQPYGPSQPVTGIALPFTFFLPIVCIVPQSQPSQYKYNLPMMVYNSLDSFYPQEPHCLLAFKQRETPFRILLVSSRFEY
jgi:hypothetical protein